MNHSLEYQIEQLKIENARLTRPPEFKYLQTDLTTVLTDLGFNKIDAYNPSVRQAIAERAYLMGVMNRCPNLLTDLPIVEACMMSGRSILSIESKIDTSEHELEPGDIETASGE